MSVQANDWTILGGRVRIGIEKNRKHLPEIEKRLTGVQTALPLPEVPARLVVEPAPPLDERGDDPKLLELLEKAADAQTKLFEHYRGVA